MCSLSYAFTACKAITGPLQLCEVAAWSHLPAECKYLASGWHDQQQQATMHSCLCIQGQAYSDPGATAYDAVDGAITAVSVKGLSAINTMVVSV